MTEISHATEHEAAVRARMDDVLRDLCGSCLGERMHRAGVAAQLPEIELLAALAWELGIVEVEPDVEVLRRLHAEGLITREIVTYAVEIEDEDSQDPAWWLAAADTCGEIPRGLRAMWRTEMDRAKQFGEAGRDAEAE